MQISQAHADAVFLLVGLSVGLLLALKAVRAPAPATRAAVVLVVVELAQGLIGFVQYFTDLPIVLVEFHLLGASLLVATLTWTLLQVRQGSAVGLSGPTWPDGLASYEMVP